MEDHHLSSFSNVQNYQDILSDLINNVNRPKSSSPRRQEASSEELPDKPAVISQLSLEAVSQEVADKVAEGKEEVVLPMPDRARFHLKKAINAYVSSGKKQSGSSVGKNIDLVI